MASSKSHHHTHPKLKPPPRPLFSCAMFRHCTDRPLSPTAAAATPPPLSSSSTATTTSGTPPLHSNGSNSYPTMIPPPPASTSVDPPPRSTSSSSSSSSSASQSFTQWRFPLHHNTPSVEPPPHYYHSPDLEDSFRAAQLHFASGNALPALRLLERALASHDFPTCPPPLLASVISSVLDPAIARPAAKVLLALLLPEPNRLPAVEAGAAAAALQAVMGTLHSPAAGSTTTAERALAALELMCTVPEGVAEVRGSAEVAAAALCGSAERIGGRGRECAIGVLAAAYGGEWAEGAPERVGRAVAAALQGECSARGRRKGLQLLKALKEAGKLREDGEDVVG